MQGGPGAAGLVAAVNVRVGEVAVTMVNAPDKVDTLTVTLANCRLEKERVQHTRIPDTSQITADKKLNASAAFQ